MAIESFIYRDMSPAVARECGYFDPTTPWKPIADVNYVHWMREEQPINKDTVIAYYPGSFGSFHEGHMHVVKETLKMLRKYGTNVLLVIAPANSEYTVSKYGSTCSLSANKERFDKIVDSYRKAPGVRDWNSYHTCVDLNPMLNHHSDQNFTDLLRDFIERNIGPYDEMTFTPFVVGGKDRNFAELDKHTQAMRSFYVRDVHGLSTSTHARRVFDPKKRLKLRVHSMWEAELFSEYFGEFYESVTPLYIGDECDRIDNSGTSAAFVTICKDYQHILPYFKYSRFYKTPLSNPTFFGTETVRLREFAGGRTIIDSDVFSGGTLGELAEYGIRLIALHDMRQYSGEVELLDIDDFRDHNFKYPFYDISSKCSLPAFTPGMHDRLEEFKEILAFRSL